MDSPKPEPRIIEFTFPSGRVERIEVPTAEQLKLPREDRPKAKPKLRLGDWVETQLRSLGITEDRYKEAKEKFGLAPTCNCPARKEWLNKVSSWWRGESG